jgi:hypothetical protein
MIIRGESVAGGGNASPFGQIMPCADSGPARLVVTHRGRDWRLPGRCVMPSALATNVHRPGYAALGFGRPRRGRVRCQVAHDDEQPVPVRPGSPIDFSAARRPAHAVAGPDRQRPELAEGEATVRAGAGHVLDPVQLGVPVRIGGFFPGPGPLERDAALMRSCRSRSRPIRTGRPRPATYPASLRKLHRVNGWTGFSGRVLAGGDRSSCL